MHGRHHNGTGKKRILEWVVERKVGCNVVVVGPLLDGCINRIGKGFTNKLARSKLTSMQHLPSMLFPWQFFIRFVKLVRGYGGVLTTLSGGKKTKNIIISFLSRESIRRIWQPYRLNNVNHLARRKINNMPGEDGKQKIFYSGIGKVVVTGRTPVIMTYNIKHQCCTTTFVEI